VLEEADNINKTTRFSVGEYKLKYQDSRLPTDNSHRLCAEYGGSFKYILPVLLP
jgi:hypothetical protein